MNDEEDLHEHQPAEAIKAKRRRKVPEIRIGGQAMSSAALQHIAAVARTRSGLIPVLPDLGLVAPVQDQLRAAMAPVAEHARQSLVEQLGPMQVLPDLGLVAPIAEHASRYFLVQSHIQTHFPAPELARSMLRGLQFDRFAEIAAAAALSQHVVARSAEAVTGLLFPIIEQMQSMTDALAAHFRNWSVLADLGHALARRGVAAARRARRAAIAGKRDIVERFVRVWLGFKNISESLLDAAIAALLDPRWNSIASDRMVDTLRAYTNKHHHTHRLIGETRLKGRYVAALDRPLATADGEITLHDVVPARSAEPDEMEITDPRLRGVLAKLTPLEVEIVQAKADGAPTWAAAATDCGQTAEKGESVRRKVRRAAAKVDVPDRLRRNPA